MKALWNELVENESGLILSAEMILVLTIAVIGLVTGLSCVQQAVVSELQDVAQAFTGLNQSYSTAAFRGCWKWGRPLSSSCGSFFIDFQDTCICSGGVVPVDCGTDICEIRGGAFYSGPVSAPAPVIQTPHCAVTTPCVDCPPPAPVTTPCVNCPPLAPSSITTLPSPMPAPQIP